MASWTSSSTSVHTSNNNGTTSASTSSSELQNLLVNRLLLIMFSRIQDHKSTHNAFRLPNAIVLQSIETLCSIVAFADTGILDLTIVKLHLARQSVDLLKDSKSTVQVIIILIMLMPLLVSMGAWQR